VLDEATEPAEIAPASRRPAVLRFSRYTLLSLITVPVGYTVLLLARHFWDINAGVLNLIVGNVLTPPSFFLYRWLVWKEGSGRSIPAEMFSFWQTVMVGAIASSTTIALADVLFDANGPLIILAGLVGQGLIFIARFFWLDKVTFVRRGNAAQAP
jgi:putative flippase GtrA